MNRFSLDWKLSDLEATRDVKVFSTFSCGGGSTMGYKRAGFKVLGNVEIDPKINAAGFMTSEGWRSRKGSIKVLTSRDLEYTKTKNPAAGPHWDRALSAAEGAALAADLQRYMNRR